MKVFKNAHNIHRQRRGRRSLKNTKINYTTDLLHHCLLNLWEDFVILQVSVQAVLSFFSGGKKTNWLRCSFVRYEVSTLSLLEGQKHSDDISGDRSPGWQTWFFTKQICLKQPKREEKLMSSFSKDKCFNWYHTDFLLSFKRMQPQPSSTLYIILCSLCLHPPRIHKIDTHTHKKNVITELRLAPSLWKHVNASLNCSTTETSQK